MPPTAAELLAALPAEDQEPDVSYEQEIETIMRALADRPVPTGAWRRLWSLGGLSTKLGLAYFAYWIRTSFQPADASSLRGSEFHGAQHREPSPVPGLPARRDGICVARVFEGEERLWQVGDPQVDEG